tara:strand:- start:879 stop:1061 length:183 start_codon:yes stop_codon:yes gene_type:complete
MPEDKRSQAEKFKKAAREAECDMDEKAFDEAVEKLAKAENTRSDSSDLTVEAKVEPLEPE